jgi:hypothetical protein
MIVQWFARLAHATLTSPTFQVARKTAGFLLVFAACAGTAAARANPEIDPGTASSALALLSGGALLLTNRLKRK